MRVDQTPPGYGEVSLIELTQPQLNPGNYRGDLM